MLHFSTSWFDRAGLASRLGGRFSFPAQKAAESFGRLMTEELLPC